MKEWEDELLEGATFQRNATFTLAMDKARQKLEKFQLPDPRFYILQILQALIASGANSIRIRDHGESGVRERGKLTIHFDGPGYTRDELVHINDFLFESGRSREKDRTRELALGLVSCMALKPQRISLTTQGHRWERIGSKESVSDAGTQEQVLEIRRSGGFEELSLLRTHVIDCQLDIHLNDQLISSGESLLRSACPWPNYHFSSGEMHGYFGIAYGTLERSALTLLRYGVQFTRRLETRIHPPLIVICEHSQLRKNASQSDVVEDSAYLQFLADLARIQRDFSVKLTQSRVPAYQREMVQAYLLAYFEPYLPPNLSTLEIDDLDADLQKILSLPLFTGTTAARYSLEQLLNAYRRDGCLLLSSLMRPRAQLRDILILTPSDPERELLQRLFENLVHVDSQYEAILDRVNARRKFEEALRPATLAEIALGEVDGIGECQLAIPDDALGQPRLYCSLDGDVRSKAFVIEGLESSCMVYTSSAHGGDWNPVRQALPRLRELVKSQLPALHQRLWERLRQANRRPKFAAKIARATDHFAFALLHLSGSEGRGEIPDEFWNARFLADRRAAMVSLADIETWLEVYPQVVLTMGGPPFEDDYAVVGSPTIRRLLQRLFGAERALEATLETPLLKERQQQQPLASCASGPRLLLPTEEDEEEELERLRQEYHAALNSESSVPVQAAPFAPPPAPAPAPVEPVEPEAVHSGPNESPFQQAVREFEALPKLVTVALREAGAEGHLGLCLDPARGDQVGRIRVMLAEREVEPLLCPPLPVCGYISLEGEPPAELLELALGRLYSALVEHLRSTERKYEQPLRKLIFQLFLHYPKLAQWRGPLTEYPLLTLRSGTAVGLGELRRAATWAGCVAYCFASDPLDKKTEGALMLVPPLTERHLELFFGLPLVRAGAPLDSDPKERLLNGIRRNLESLAALPQTNLDPSFASGVGWGEGTRWFGSRKKYFVEHLNSGLTELNPAHALLRSILKSPRGPELMAPLLASSVYTAINRALHEIDDSHELAFLEALLDRL